MAGCRFLRESAAEASGRTTAGFPTTRRGTRPSLPIAPDDPVADTVVPADDCLRPELAGGERPLRYEPSAERQAATADRRTVRSQASARPPVFPARHDVPKAMIVDGCRQIPGWGDWNYHGSKAQRRFHKNPENRRSIFPNCDKCDDCNRQNAAAAACHSSSPIPSANAVLRRLPADDRHVLRTLLKGAGRHPSLQLPRFRII